MSEVNGAEVPVLSGTQRVTYNPDFFDVATIEEAKGVILGPEKHETVDQRWERETPYLGGLMQEHLGVSQKSLVLDYGCGVGRLSKEMIKRTQCRAVGVDFQPNMRAFAANYVDDARFMSCDATMLSVFKPESFDAAIAVWILQHCLRPAENVQHIVQNLRAGGRLFVVNDLRLLPTKEVGWIRDAIDIKAMLNESLKNVLEIPLDISIGKDLAPRSFCGVWEK